MAVADTLQELATDIQSAYTAISNKGGTIPANKNTNSLATAIGSIPSGSTPTGEIAITENGTYDVTDYASAQVNVADYWEYATSLQYTFVNATQVPDKIELNLPNLENFIYGPAINCQPKEYIIHLSETGKCTSMVGACRWGNNLSQNSDKRQLTLIKITGDLSNVTSYQNCFTAVLWSDIGLQPNATIDADLDFSSATNVTNMFLNCWNLVNVRFVPNTLKISLTMSASRLLSTDSLVSIINGLNETVTGQTLTLHATPKAALSTIMGTVALDTTQTYHIFTADQSGTVSLLDFATQTKGWTVA